MRERPILFSGPMVRALLAGTKTQTRRVVKPQFAADALPVEMPATDPAGGWVVPGYSGVWWCDAAANPDDARRCPYGQPGDRLWVKEAWHVAAVHDHVPGGELGFGVPPQVQYEAIGDGRDETRVKWGRYRHARFMPRWASRITLEITDVRVERLQDISEADSRAEGVESLPLETRRSTPRADYAALWEQINGAGSWDVNPWVWVVEFTGARAPRVDPAAQETKG